MKGILVFEMLNTTVSDNVSWQGIFVLSDANSICIIAIHYKEDILMKQFIQKTAATVFVSFSFVQLVH